MKRAFFLVTLLLANYILVSCTGLLFALRPWDPAGAEWLSHHDQIYFFYFIGLQIPGVVPFMLSWGEPSLVALAEQVAFGFSIYLTVVTLRGMKKNDLAKIRKFRRHTLLLAISTVAVRLLSPLVFPPSISPEDSGLYDVHNPMVAVLWVNFDSTIILTLLCVQIFVIRSPRPASEKE